LPLWTGPWEIFPEGSEMKKSLSLFLSILGGLLLIFVILVSSLQYVMLDEDWFYKEYEKLGKEGQLILNMSLSDTTNALMQLVRYMEGDADSIQLSVTIDGEVQDMYNRREIDHMVDVQRLYQSFRSLRNAAALLFLLLVGTVLFLERKAGLQSLYRGYLLACVLFLLLALLMGAMVLSDFGNFWIRFHHLFFTNDLWLLDPATDNMINICPEQLFYDIVLRFGCLSLLAAGLLALLSGFGLRRKKTL